MPLVDKPGTVQHSKEAGPALAVLRARGIDAVLNVIGDGPQRSELERLVAREHIGDRVSFRGGRPRSDVVRCLADSDLAIHPSVSEALPTAVMEAMICGAVAVAANNTGAGSVIGHGKTGFLVPVGDVMALADCIEMLARNAALRREVGQRGARVGTGEGRRRGGGSLVAGPVRGCGGQASRTTALTMTIVDVGPVCPLPASGGCVLDER